MFRFNKFLVNYDDADAGGDGSGDGKKDDDKKDEGKKYTQAELDQMFVDRAKQATRTALTDLFKELGVENADTLKSVIAAAKKAEDEQKTELQKATDAAQAVKDALETANEQHKVEKTALEKRLLDAEIRSLASSPLLGKEGKDGKKEVLRKAFLRNAIDDVLVLINRETIVDAEGKYTGIEEALAKLAISRPHMLEGVEQTVTKGTPLPDAATFKKGRKSQEPETKKHSTF